MTTLETLRTKVKDMLTSRDGLIQQLADLDAKHAAEEVEPARELAEADAAARKIRDALERPDRLRAEALARSLRHAREREPLEARLQAIDHRGLARYGAALDRIVQRLRREPVPSPVEIVRGGVVVGMEGLDVLERRQALMALVIQLSAESRDLWRLPSEELEARIADRTRQLAEASEGTDFEVEV
jgi:hypothetical protein